MVKDFLSLSDFSSEEILAFLDLADELKAKQQKREKHHILEGKTLAMIFEKPSLRTRATFHTGMYQLGGDSMLIETTLGTRESVPDVARNLSRWVDGVMARTFRHSDVLQLAEHATVPVINALTDQLHPCQILADAQALREHRGKDLSALKLAFVGDGNNVFHSWAYFAAKIPVNLTLVCPEGYEPDMNLVAAARKTASGAIDVVHDVDAGVSGADAVYTDVWASMGQEKETEEREQAFAAYQVNDTLMAKANDDALFMHCLPAHRGSEVTDSVMDSPQSIVFDQAENRLHAQKAVMATLMR
jgi:ornithine carbamoyltransferase